jgi:hypothetical protein
MAPSPAITPGRNTEESTMQMTRPTHSVVTDRGVAVSQHTSLERAEAEAHRRSARSGHPHQVRAVTPRSIAQPEPPRPRGRPPRSGEPTTLEIRVRVTEAEREQLRAKAEAAGIDVSAYVRKRCGL